MERQKQRGLEGGESRSIVTSSSDVLFKRQENAIEIHGEMHFSQRDIVHFIMNKLLQNIPLSVLLDLVESTCDLSIETILATTKIGTFTINKCVNILCDTAWVIIDVLSRINPFHVFEFVVNAQRSAMGKTGDVLVSGIQSVATGVGSVSNAALNRLSRSGLALAGGVVGGSRSGEPNGFGRMRKDSSVNHENVLESKVSLFVVLERGNTLIYLSMVTHTLDDFNLFHCSSFIDYKKWNRYPNSWHTQKDGERKHSVDMLRNVHNV